jgi:predicted NBD/HSP70 family sugar kinase
MALAELRYGDGVGCDNFLVIDLGLGIGCGIVLNGSIFAGATGKSGEIGHTVLEVDGPALHLRKAGLHRGYGIGVGTSKCAKKSLENDESITILRRSFRRKRASQP